MGKKSKQTQNWKTAYSIGIYSYIWDYTTWDNPKLF